MNMFKYLFLLIYFFPTLLWAGSWSGHADLGFTDTSGNSDTSSLNAGFGLAYETGRWTHGLELDGLRNEDSGVVNAERYEAEGKSQYALSEISYVFGQLDYERDEFAGVFQRTSETVGYGQTLIDSDPHKLVGEISAGATQVEFQDGEEESGVIARLGLDYDWQISDSAKFGEDLSVESGGVNTYIESETSLKMSIIGSLFAKLSYIIKHNTEVPAGTENTDTISAVSLSYEFGNNEE